MGHSACTCKLKATESHQTGKCWATHKMLQAPNCASNQKVLPTPYFKQEADISSSQSIFVFPLQHNRGNWVPPENSHGSESHYSSLQEEGAPITVILNSDCKLETPRSFKTYSNSWDPPLHYLDLKLGSGTQAFLQVPWMAPVNTESENLSQVTPKMLHILGRVQVCDFK